MEKQKASHQYKHDSQHFRFKNQDLKIQNQTSHNFDLNEYQIGTVSHLDDEDSRLQLKGLLGLKSPGSQMQKNSQIRKIKNDIQNLDAYQSFAISSFAESKNCVPNLDIQSYAKFPTVNAPSLQLGQQDQDMEDSIQQHKGSYQTGKIKPINKTKQRALKNCQTSENTQSIDFNNINSFNSFNPKQGLKKTEKFDFDLKKSKKVIINPRLIKDSYVQADDMTQRNQSLPSIIKLQQQIARLNKVCRSNEDTIQRISKTAQSLSRKCTQYEEKVEICEKQIMDKQKSIQKVLLENNRLRKIINDYQMKEKYQNKQSKSSHAKIVLSQKSSMSSLAGLLKNQKEGYSQSSQNNYLCLQMLSPQQSLSLLDKLLKKVAKSSYMKKKILGDSRIIEILSKLKHQAH